MDHLWLLTATPAYISDYFLVLVLEAANLARGKKSEMQPAFSTFSETTLNDHNTEILSQIARGSARIFYHPISSMLQKFSIAELKACKSQKNTPVRQPTPLNRWTGHLSTHPSARSCLGCFPQII